MLPTLLTTNEALIRSSCREHIESLEHWLRRLIDELLTSAYNDYFNYVDESGNRIIKKALSETVDQRCASEPFRYPRKVDALLLDDVINVICHPDLYRSHFRIALRHAFPDGLPETRTFLGRIAAPRNNLAHANPISMRQAEQIICYTNDVIDSLKIYYMEQGKRETYNAPSFLRFVDSFGNELSRTQFGPNYVGGILYSFTEIEQNYLRPGETLVVEVDVDPAFDKSEYELKWKVNASPQPQFDQQTRMVLPIDIEHVRESTHIQCQIIAKRPWHRFGNYDDSMGVLYKVLPPI